MKKTVLLSIVVLLLGVLILTGCTSKTNQIESIKIGAILILTGEGSSWGQASQNGMKMAVDKINADGGVLGRKLEVVYEDDPGSDPKLAVTAFKKLTEGDRVSAIVGPNWTSAGLPLVDLVAETKTVMISPSLGSEKFNENNKYLFNTWPHDFILSSKLADYVYNKSARRIALIGAQEVWVKEQTNAFTKRFQELGGQIIVTVEPIPLTKEVSTEALKIKNAKNLDAIVSTTDGVLVGSLIAQKVRELGVNLPIYSITIDADAIAAAKGAYEGMEFLTFLTPSANFIKEYKSRFHKDVDISADSAYDAVMLLVQAMKATRATDSESIAEYLGNVKEYNGESGRLVSDGKRGFVKDYIVEKIEKSVPVLIK